MSFTVAEDSAMPTWQSSCWFRPWHATLFISLYIYYSYVYHWSQWPPCDSHQWHHHLHATGTLDYLPAFSQFFLSFFLYLFIVFAPKVLSSLGLKY